MIQGYHLENRENISASEVSEGTFPRRMEKIFHFKDNAEE